MSCSAKVAEAFVKMQEDLKNPQNSAYNPISKSKYAPLSEILNFIRPILAKQGLAVCQNLGSTSEGKPTIQTIIIHESGETIETKELCLDSDSNKRMSILQEMGSSVTYGKRYQLCAFLGIAPENDNDGNESTPKANQTTQTAKEKPGNGTSNSTSKPIDKPKSKPGQNKPGNKSKVTKTTTKDGTEIEEMVGGKPNGLNPLILKIKGISAPLYKKFEKVVNQDTITADMIVKEAQNMLGDLLSQDQLGHIKEELDC
jgi:hypothetical protein